MTRTGLTIHTDHNTVHAVFEIGHDDYDGLSVVLYCPTQPDTDTPQPVRAAPIELYSWVLTADEVELIDPVMATAIMYTMIHGGSVDQWRSAHDDGDGAGEQAGD